MGEAVGPDWSGRLDKIWRSVAEPGLAALVVSSPINVHYLSGFDGSQGVLVLTGTGPHLLLDGRYDRGARAAQRAGALGPVTIHCAAASFEKAFTDFVRALPPGTVTFESEIVTVAELAAWQAAVPGRTFTPLKGPVTTRRLVKDAFEIGRLREACARLSDVAVRLPAWARPGCTERAVAADIDHALRIAGFSRPAFETIVASGPNSALPHARPTDRRLQQGDLVLLDFGGVLGGYCCDLTRMVSVGQVQANARGLFDAVRAAHAAALASVRAGVMASDVDRSARDVLERLGLGESFPHATGHGLGLEVHEAPRIGRAGSDPGVRLEAGMVCTIEPGAYVEGIGGVRLEDDVVVTAEGCEVLTSAPRDLVMV
jgi:Xaa-Pro aminopeptidase